MSDANRPVHSGQCFCGEVRIEAKGAPFAMGYCHCGDCRAWAAAPVNAFTLWPAGSVQITAGEGSVLTYCKTERSHRKSCRHCGGHVMTEHPGGNFTDVYSAILKDLAFAPELHVHYTERVVSIRDGLPKYRHLPEAFGGAGETMPE